LETGLEDWQQLIIGVGITTAAWIAATLLTKPADEQTLKSFCKKINPGGQGWTHVYEAISAEGGAIEGDAVNLPRGILCMVLGSAFVYASLFATGLWLYGQVLPAISLSMVAAAACIALFNLWRKQ